ncbi:MAG: hypothetical protein JEZ03_04950 [Bacteroidales bacterium]|nr:hypothetical protein [Bacteroidales bacterium]
MEFDKLDSKLQQKFESFEVNPPAHIWEKVKQNLEQSANESIPSKKDSFFKPRNISVLVILLAATLSVLLFNKIQSPAKLGESISEVRYIPVPDQKSEKEIVVENEFVEDQTKEDKIIKSNIPFSENTPEIQTLVGEKQEIKTEILVIKNDVNISEDKQQTIVTKSDTPIDNITGKDLKSVDENIIYEDNISGDSYQPKSMPGSLKDSIINLYNQELNLGSKGEWNLGFSYTVDQTNKQQGLSDKFMSYSAEATIAFKRNNIFFQSGLELVKSMDRFDYSISHQTYDYIGSYEHVYHVEFDISSGTPVPNYFTEQIDVYDSVAHEIKSEKEFQYTYLQIPLTIGYIFPARHKFSYSVRTGPIYSVLIKDEVRKLINEEEYDIIGIDDNSISRLDLNWQYLVAVDVNYQLNHHMNIYLEPRFKYYYEGVYKVNQIKKGKPYSIGLRFGLNYKL